jgi:hypothetical protein
VSEAKSSPLLPAACPRCRATQIEVRSTSPVAGVWTVFACVTCLYAWRSTEPEENANPDKYPAAFRLKPEQLADLAVIPTIPPLRSPSAK